MRVVIRSRDDSGAISTVADVSQEYLVPEKTRLHWDIARPTIAAVVLEEMEKVYVNPAHNYLDVLVTRKTV